MSLNLKTLSLLKRLLISFFLVFAEYSRTNRRRRINQKHITTLLLVAIIFVVMLFTRFLYFGIGEEVKRESKVFGLKKIKTMWSV
jgi:hypothetical protein